MQTATQSAEPSVAKDPRYPLTGTITEHQIRQVTTDGSSYVVLTLDRGQGKDPVKAVAFDEKFNQVMDLIDANAQPVRLFGFFEKREYADGETGEIKTSSRFRVLWAGVPRQEQPRQQQGRPQNRTQGNRSGGQQRQNNGGQAPQQQAQGGQRQQSGQRQQGGNAPRNGAQNRQGNAQGNRNGSNQRQAGGDWWPN